MRTRFVVRSSHARGGRTTSPAKSAKPEMNVENESMKNRNCRSRARSSGRAKYCAYVLQLRAPRRSARDVVGGPPFSRNVVQAMLVADISAAR